MKHEIKPCENCDLDFLWERFDESYDEKSPADDGAAEELFVFKVTDSRGAIIAGCVLDVDKTKIAEFNSLWVDERYRRRGMGTGSLQVAFFKKQGFTVNSEHENEPRWYDMEKRI